MDEKAKVAGGENTRAQHYVFAFNAKLQTYPTVKSKLHYRHIFFYHFQSATPFVRRRLSKLINRPTQITYCV